LSDARNRATKFAESVQPLPQQKENLQFPLAGQSAQSLSHFSPQRVAIARLRLELSMLFRTGMIYHIRYLNPFWLTPCYYTSNHQSVPEQNDARMQDRSKISITALRDILAGPTFRDQRLLGARCLDYRVRRSNIRAWGLALVWCGCRCHTNDTRL